MRNLSILALLLTASCATAESRSEDLRVVCGGATLVEDPLLVSSSIVSSVRPLYDAHITKLQPQPRLLGAQLHVLAQPSLTREWLARVLRCHEARIAAGEGAARTNDPYSLPGSPLAISVDSDGDGFLVSVRALSSDAAHRVLDRAQAFASAH
jgi:hypothetical protein